MLKKYHWMGKIFLTALLALCLAACFVACNNNEDDGGGSGGSGTKKDPEVVECDVHDFGDWQIVVTATCQKAGQRRRICSVCKKEETESYYVDHVLTEHAAVAATCTNAGSIRYWTCSVCNKYFSDGSGASEISSSSLTVAAKGHTLVKHNAVESTCAVRGNVEYWSCSACGKKFSDAKGKTEINSVETALAAHTLTSHPRVEASCDAEGNIQYWSCSVCNKNFSDEGETAVSSVVLPITHGDLEAHAAKQATCTQEGNVAYWICPICSRYFSDAEAKREIVDKVTLLPMTPHEFQYYEAHENSCRENGNVEYWGCVNCDTKYADVERTVPIAEVAIPAYAHNMTFHYATPATCSAEGNIAYYECSLCNMNYTYDSDEGKYVDAERVVLPKIPHSIQYMDGTLLGAACLGDKKYYFCEECGELFADSEGKRKYEIEETEHIMTHHAGIAATCDAPGSKEYWECEVCNKKYLDEKGTALVTDVDIDAFGHSYQHYDAVVSTCTLPGKSEHYYCVRCGTYFEKIDATTYSEVSEESLVISPLGHDLQIREAVPATCTKTGLTEGRYCTRCDLVEEEQQIVDMIPHTFDDGICTVCETHQTITISFDDNDNNGNTDVENMTITAHDDFTFEVPQYSGYTFIGWSLTNNTMVTDNTGKSILPWTWNYADTEVVAVWWDPSNQADCKKITYYSTYDIPSNNIVNAKVGTNVPLAPLTGRTGYTFVNWTQGGEPVTILNSISSGVTLTANWSVNQYTITFDPQGGTLDTTEKTYNYGDALVIGNFPKPTMTGKTFVGWFIEGESEPYSGTAMPAENFRLQARWTTYQIVSYSFDNKTYIKASDTSDERLTGELFKATMKDTDGEGATSVDVRIIEGEKEGGYAVAGKEITVRITIEGKYGKKKIITIMGIKVYDAPTLVFTDEEGTALAEPEFAGYNITDKLDGALVGASGKDSFGEDTSIIVYGKTAHPAYTDAILYADLTAAQKAETVVTAEGEGLLYKAKPDGTAQRRVATVYGDEWTEYKTSDGENVLYVILTSEDKAKKVDLATEEDFLYKEGENGIALVRVPTRYSVDTYEDVKECVIDYGQLSASSVTTTIVVRSTDVAGNVTEKEIENVKIYGLPTITIANRILGVKEDADLTKEFFGVSAKDSFDNDLEVEMTVTGGTQTIGNRLTVTFTAEDEQGNGVVETLIVKVLGTPTIERPRKTAFTESDVIDETTLGVVGLDTFGDEVDDVVVVKKDSSAAQVKGTELIYTITVTDVAGNTTSADITVKIYDKPIFAATAETLAVSEDADVSLASSFGITAKDDFNKPLTVVVTLKSGEVVKGGTPVFVFSASNAVGEFAQIEKTCKIYAQEDIELTYNEHQSDSASIIGHGEEFSAAATGTDDSACVVTIVSADGEELIAGTETDIRLRATDLAGNYKDSEVIPAVKLYDIPTVTFLRHGGELYLTAAEYAAYDGGSLSLDALFSAEDSFGEILALSFDVKSESTATVLKVGITSDADSAGNVYDEIVDIQVLAADQSVISFSVDGKIVDETARLTKDDEATVLPHSFTGYEFKGWTLDGVKVADADGALTAKWAKESGHYTLIADITAKQYTVQLYVNDENIGSAKLTYGQDYTLSLPSLGVGQTFNGWLFDYERITDGRGVSLLPWNKVGDMFFLDADITTTQSILEYRLSAGGELQMQMVTYGMDFSLPIPETDGYAFEGWCIDNTVITDNKGNGLAKWTRTGSKYTLTAKTNLLGYIVNYELNGGINNENNIASYTALTIGGGFNLLDPVKEAYMNVEYSEDHANGYFVKKSTYTTYTFDGWYAEERFVNRIRVITVDKGNVDLYAKWIETVTVKQENVTYYYDEDAGIVYFGSYPQKQVTDAEQITKLNGVSGITPTADNNANWTPYGFYIRGEVTNYMWYYDYLDMTSGVKYRGVYFTTHRPTAVTEESSAEKSYQDENGFLPETIYWFEYEPIAWKVLLTEDGKAFLYSDLIIDAYEIDHDLVDLEYIGSQLDAWLESDFVAQAISLERMTSVVADTVDGESRNVFLLSKAQVTAAGYGFSGSAGATDVNRRKQASAYATCMGVYISGSGNYSGNGSWWLRTAANETSFNYVGYSGSLGVDSAVKSYYGVVPGLWLDSEIFYSYDGDGDCYYVTGYNGFLSALTIPATYDDGVHGEKSVTAIADYAFWGSSVRNVILPSGLVKIGKYAFYQCKDLAEVTIPDTVTTIGECAFYGCVSLTSVTLEGVSTIGENAFYGCLRLREVVNLAGLALSLKSDSFGCVARYAVSITDSSDRSYAGDGKFVILEIGGDLAVIAYLGEETNVTIPDAAEAVLENAFYNNDTVTSITVSDSVEYLDAKAFASCSALTSVTFADTTTWYVADTKEKQQAKEGGVAIDVTNASANASELLSSSAYWYKK